MRPLNVLTAFVVLLTLAWLVSVPSDLGIWPLVDVQGVASGWWALRRHGIYLSGLWALGLMSLAMVLGLRLPLLERWLGGMDRVYRLHKWTGIGVAVMAVLHWVAKQGGSWIGASWGRAGKPGRDAVWAIMTDSRSLAKDVGEWAFYLLLVLVLVTLWQRLLPYQRWRVTHRLWPLVYLAVAFHGAALMPLYLWTSPLGVLMGLMMIMGCVASVWALVGGIGRRRRHPAHVHTVQRLGAAPDAPLEVVCAPDSSWPGHRAGQFAFVRFHPQEDAHPFTIASAPGCLGQDAQGRTLLRLVIKPLGDYTAGLHQRLKPGQTMEIEGPYGCFDGQGMAGQQQIWIAAGIGITPFLAWLEARQPDQPKVGQHPPVLRLHYCVRDAAHEPLLARVRHLCAHAEPPVPLTVHDEAQGQRLQPHMLEAEASAPLDIWFCGPQGLGQTLQRIAQTRRERWRLHREFFALR